MKNRYVEIMDVLVYCILYLIYRRISIKTAYGWKTCFDVQFYINAPRVIKDFWCSLIDLNNFFRCKPQNYFISTLTFGGIFGVYFFAKYSSPDILVDCRFEMWHQCVPLVIKLWSYCHQLQSKHLLLQKLRFDRKDIYLFNFYMCYYHVLLNKNLYLFT